MISFPIIFAVVLAFFVVLGVFTVLFGGKVKPPPPLSDFMVVTSLYAPDARKYYAFKSRKTIQEDPEEGEEKESSSAAYGIAQKLLSGLISYISEGLKSGDKAKDLAITGVTREKHANNKLYSALGISGFLVGFYVLVGLGGIVSISPVVLVLMILVGGIVGFILPDTIIKGRAQDLRSEFDNALYSWLDIVSQYLSTGEEAGNAMLKAASLSKNWAFQMLYTALSTAQFRNLPAYLGFEALSKERGLDVLDSLKDSLQLSTEYGIEMRDTLNSFINSHREQVVIDSDAQVKSFGETSALPLGLVVIGFVILLMYPGIQGLLGSSSLVGGFSLEDDTAEGP